MSETTIQPETQEKSEVSFIQTEIGKFNQAINEADLKELVVKYKDLRISDVNDKDGYNAVYDARQVLKKKRVEITNKGKFMRESAIAFQKAVIARENEFVNIIEPTEKLLKSEEDRIDKDREQIKKEEEEREAQRINNMIQKLAAVNYAVDYGQLKNLNDESFEELLKEATADFNKAEEKRRQEEAEQLRLKQEEEQRIENARKEKEAELERIAKEQEAERARIAEQQEAIRKQQEEIARQQAQRDLEFRQEQDRIQKYNDEVRAKLKEAEEKLEAAKRAIQEKKEAEEREQQRLIQEEADRKAREEQAAKDEIERQNRINAEAEQRSKYFEDRDRFAFLTQQLEVHFINSSVWSSMKSERGKGVAYEVQSLIRNAHAMCKEHSNKNQKVSE